MYLLKKMYIVILVFKSARNILGSVDSYNIKTALTGVTGTTKSTLLIIIVGYKTGYQTN